MKNARTPAAPLSPAALLAVAGLVALPASLTALVVAVETREGRPDSYVFGTLVVCLACAFVEWIDVSPRARLVARIVWVPLMPLLAGATTGFALALVHPKRDGIGALFGGAGIGAFGSMFLYPALLVAALLTQGWAWGCARWVRARWAGGVVRSSGPP